MFYLIEEEVYKVRDTARTVATNAWILHEAIIALGQTNWLMRWIVKRALQRTIRKHEGFQVKQDSNWEYPSSQKALEVLSS